MAKKKKNSKKEVNSLHYRDNGGIGLLGFLK